MKKIYSEDFDAKDTMKSEEKIIRLLEEIKKNNEALMSVSIETAK